MIHYNFFLSYYTKVAKKLVALESQNPPNHFKS